MASSKGYPDNYNTFIYFEDGFYNTFSYNFKLWKSSYDGL